MANIAGSHAIEFLHGAQMLLFFSFLALVDLHLIFEKRVYFKLDFYCLCSQQKSRPKLKFVEIYFSKSIFQKTSADQQRDNILSDKYCLEIENMH